MSNLVEPVLKMLKSNQSKVVVISAILAGLAIGYSLLNSDGFYQEVWIWYVLMSFFSALWRREDWKVYFQGFRPIIVWEANSLMLSLQSTDIEEPTLAPALTEEQAVAIMTAVIGRVKSLTSKFSWSIWRVESLFFQWCGIQDDCSSFW